MDMDEAMKSHVKEMMDTGYPFEIESGNNMISDIASIWSIK